MEKPQIYIQGMLGLGDNLHERAIIRQLKETHEVWLETVWPVIFHDMPEVNLVRRETKLRTQDKNADREIYKFKTDIPNIRERKAIWYKPQDVRRCGSVLAAMSENLGLPIGDYSFPIKESWRTLVQAMILSWKTDKPILIYRPLIERREWTGCPVRNPDIETYRDLFLSIKDDFFVVSIADLAPGKEWIVSHEINADIEFHSGELPVEIIAGLVNESAVTFNSPGFMTVMSKAIGTPNITIFGGYENSLSFTPGNSPYLGIDPIRSCQCFSHRHHCDKRIDVPLAKQRIKDFINEFATSRA